MVDLQPSAAHQSQSFPSSGLDSTEMMGRGFQVFLSPSSYLGNGLMAARLAALGALGALGDEGVEQHCMVLLRTPPTAHRSVLLCFYSDSFGVESFPKFLPAQEIPGQVELRGCGLPSGRRPQW